MRHQLLPVAVAALDQAAPQTVSLHDDAVPRFVHAGLDRGVEHRFVVHHPGRFDAAGRRNDHDGLGVVDACGKLVRRETPEHHRMHRADPRTRQHGDDRFGNHRHVDDHAIAFAHAQCIQRTGETGSGVEQFGVGVGPLGRGDG